MPACWPHRSTSPASARRSWASRRCTPTCRPATPARKKELTQAELAERDLWVMPEGHCFRSQVLSYCQPKKQADAPAIRFESGNIQTLIRLVDEGLGATVLPDLVCANCPPHRRKHQARPLVAPAPVREIGFVTARSDLRRQVTEALEAVLRPALEKALTPAPRRAKHLDPLFGA